MSLEWEDNACLTVGDYRGSEQSWFDGKLRKVKHLIVAKRDNLDLNKNKLTIKNTCRDSSCLNNSHFSLTFANKYLKCTTLNCEGAIRAKGMCSSCYNHHRSNWIHNNRPSKKEFIDYKLLKSKTCQADECNTKVSKKENRYCSKCARSWELNNHPHKKLFIKNKNRLKRELKNKTILNKERAQLLFFLIVFSKEGKCQKWPHDLNSDGYPRSITLNFGTTRISFETACRASLFLKELNLELDKHCLHDPILCDSKSCVNPFHLRWGSAQDNVKDTKLNRVVKQCLLSNIDIRKDVDILIDVWNSKRSYKEISADIIKSINGDL